MIAKCTHCRCKKQIIFDSWFNLAIKSGLVDEPEKYHIRLCTKCVLEFARTQMLELTNNQIIQLAGKGRPICQNVK